MRDLVRRLNASGLGAVGFMYYSGHGAAASDTGVNYLIPVDVREPGSPSFWDESLKLDEIIKLLEGAPAAAKFLVFDACRNELRVPTKSTSKGFLAEQQGMFIAYATAAGRTASDHGDRGGPYAQALAAEFLRQGLDHVSFFQNVKEAVFAKTRGLQQPWESNGLFRRVYLAGEPKSGQPPGLPLDGIDQARAAAFINETEDQARLEEFIRQFGDTPYAEMARARLEQLRKKGKTAAALHRTRHPRVSRLG